MKKIIEYLVMGFVCGGLGSAGKMWINHKPIQLDTIFWSAIETSMAVTLVIILVNRFTTPKSQIDSK